VPIVRVTFYEGRSDEKKQELAEAITDAVNRVAGSRREAIHVIFEEVARKNWYSGGRTTPAPSPAE
jgi:4-oxalocrotonate tautomerase